MIDIGKHGRHRRPAADFKKNNSDHSVRESVRGIAHSEDIKSFRGMSMRTRKGAFKKMNAKRLDRHVRNADMTDIMALSVGKRLRCRELVADSSMPFGARS